MKKRCKQINFFINERRLYGILLFIAVAGLLLMDFVLAVPQTFNVHGRLTDSSGNALTGLYNMTFRIYDSLTAPVASRIWEAPNRSIITDSYGVYSLIISNVNLSSGLQYYLGVTVNNDNEMLPRMNLTTVPYAFWANVSEALNTTGMYSIGGLGVGLMTSGGGLLNVNGNISVTGYILDLGGGTINIGDGTDNVDIINGTLYADTSHNVGIGTKTPSAKLDVRGNGNFSGTIYVNNGTDVLSLVGSGGLWTNTSSYVYLLDTGMNVSIGTNTPPEARLDVKMDSPPVTVDSTNYYKALQARARDIPISAGVTDYGYRVGLRIESYIDTAAFAGTLTDQRGLWSRVGIYSGTGTVTNSYAAYLQTLTNTGTITNAYGVYQVGSGTKNYFEGNIGIGTTGPQYKLDIVGSDNVIARINSTGTDSNVRLYLQNDAKVWGIYVNGDSQHNDAFYIRDSGGSERFLINTLGYVGIGTNLPTAKLEVNNAVDGTKTLHLNHSSSGVWGQDAPFIVMSYVGSARTDIYTGAGNELVINHTGSNLWLETDSSKNIVMQMRGGNVGIGTTTPESKLNTQITARTTAFNAGDYSTWADLMVRNPVSTGSQYAATGIALLPHGLVNTNAGTGIAAVKSSASDYDADLVFITRPNAAVATEKMRITNAGNIGIGTNNPTATLDVRQADFNVPIANFSSTTSGIHSAGIGVDAAGANWGTAIFYQGLKKLVIESNGAVLIGPTFVNLNTSANSLAVEGSVGIGTILPGSLLEIKKSGAGMWGLNVSGTFYVNDTTVCLGGTSGGNCITSWGGTSGGDGTGGWINDSLATNTSLNVNILANGNLSVANGNVGIGTLYPLAIDGGATTRLHVDVGSGTGNIEVARFEGGGDTDNTYGVVRIGHNNDRGFFVKGGRQVGNIPIAIMGLTDNSGTMTDIMTFLNGNVGIGTTTPSSKLTIGGGSVNFTGGVARITTGDNVYFDIEATNSGGAIRFATGGNAATNTRLYINPSGNVGIGTTNPTQKLVVSGTLNVTGGATTQGLIVDSGGDVGIGSDSPNQKLVVVGDVNFTGTLIAKYANVTDMQITGNITMRDNIINSTIGNVSITSREGSVIIRLGG